MTKLIKQPYGLILPSVIVLFVLTIALGCSPASNKLDEGAIEYSIKYVDFADDNLLITVLPETLKMSFKENDTSIKIEGFFGIFCLTHIYQHKSGNMITLLKMMDKKFKYETKEKMSSLDFSKIDTIKIEFQNVTKTIAGYNCKKALAYIDSGKAPVEIYYTNDIAIENPNINNPFDKIPGVLMQFQLKMNNINMQLTAQKVTNKEVSDKDFEIPTDYKTVKKEEMKKILESLSEEEGVSK